jgi:hypothetical protein
MELQPLALTRSTGITSSPKKAKRVRSLSRQAINSGAIPSAIPSTRQNTMYKDTSRESTLIYNETKVTENRS